MMIHNMKSRDPPSPELTNRKSRIPLSPEISTKQDTIGSVSLETNSMEDATDIVAMETIDPVKETKSLVSPEIQLRRRAFGKRRVALNVGGIR